MNRQDELNNGLAATKNLSECLSIDQEHLIKQVLSTLFDMESLNTLLSTLEENRTLGILPRMRLIGKLLAKTFNDPTQKSKVTCAFSTHISDTVRGWACFMIPAQQPEPSLAEQLKLIRTFADDDHFGVREWAWMAVRPMIESHIDEAITLLMPWVYESSPYLRRFAVECIRPRGVWSRHIPALKENPALALSLLEPLKNEPEVYVQDSVANWLNDASKSQPDWIYQLCTRWQKESQTKNTQRIAKRALRSINKSKK